MFGMMRKGDEQPERGFAGAATTPAQSYAGRRELLHHISNFLLDHQLDVNPGNLTVAQEVISGSNPALSSRIAARQNADEPITQAWLDDVLSEAEQASKSKAEAAERAALDALIGKIEQSLQQFAQHTGEASASATAYRAALAETAASLEAARPLVEFPTLTALTRSMLERSRSVEEEMRRRDEEASGLRESLQSARADAAMNQLTGMDNARSFEAVLEREYRAAREASEALSIAFCDIDRFEAIVDTHGNETGDRVIQALARGLQRISAQSCHVSHKSGEEFVLLFRGLTPDEARRELDNAREIFSQRKLVDRKTHVEIGSVTFSGGVADALAYGEAKAAINAAEKALKAAKQQGQNRIVMAAKGA